MTKKSRYFLILLGFIIFFVLAPIMILYVRGVSFNFDTKTFSPTGILAVVTEPKKSAVYLDGELKRTGPGDIKFLKQGEYQVTISYPGFYDWNKRLSIASGQVTWANPSNGKIYLFLKEPTVTNIGSGISDFYTQGNFLLYLQNQSAVITSISNPDNRKNYPLPKAANKIISIDEKEKNFVFGSHENNLIYFNSSQGQAVDLNSLFKSTVKFQFSDGVLYALSEKNLYEVNVDSKKLNLIVAGIEDFYFQNDDLYLLKKSETGLTLSLSRKSSYQTSQVIISDLPDLNNPQIFVSFNKHAFILSNGTLYSASLEMKQLATSVSSFNFKPALTQIPFIQSGELDYFDTLDKKINFITRNISEMKDPQIVFNIDYAFYSSSKDVKAIELDSRGSQNSYTFYSGQDIQKFFVDDAGKNLLVLDNGEIKNLIIR